MANKDRKIIQLHEYLQICKFKQGIQFATYQTNGDFKKGQ